ncbi:MAG: hypothetical protein J0L94_08580 [Rhodothermia bacterium]|nr:hypothetical protein [Rhodothermia bacterium]
MSDFSEDVTPTGLFLVMAKAEVVAVAPNPTLKHGVKFKAEKISGLLNAARCIENIKPT